jgi:hypothetical protein
MHCGCDWAGNEEKMVHSEGKDKERVVAILRF